MELFNKINVESNKINIEQNKNNIESNKINIEQNKNNIEPNKNNIEYNKNNIEYNKKIINPINTNIDEIIIDNKNSPNSENSSDSGNSDKIKKEKLLKIMKMKLQKKEMELEIKPDFNNTIKIYNEDYKDSNEYTFEFDNFIKINKLSINNVELPKNKNNISNRNNQLKIFYNNKFFQLSLEPDYYNRYELIENLNDNFEANEILITCNINKNDEIIFNSKNNIIFNMLDTDNSILNTLGFINGDYKNENSYKSHYPISIIDNIYYLGFMNLYDEPLFKINMDNNEITLLVDIDFNNTEINELIVKFFFTPQCPILNQKYEHFYKKHSFNIIF